VLGIRRAGGVFAADLLLAVACLLSVWLGAKPISPGVTWHDLNQACRYATDVIALAPGGRVAAQGPPEQVVTAALVEELFGLSCRIIDDPETGTPMIVPRSRSVGGSVGSADDRGGRVAVGPLGQLWNQPVQQVRQAQHADE
jgi:hypothetical protein